MNDPHNFDCMIYVIEETHDDAPELIDWYFNINERIAMQAELMVEHKSCESYQFKYTGAANKIQQAIKYYRDFLKDGERSHQIVNSSTMDAERRLINAFREEVSKEIITSVKTEAGEIVDFDVAKEAYSKEAMKPEADQLKVKPDTPYRLVCIDCGNESLTFDATCHWSPEKQDWVLNEVVEGIIPYCGDCADGTDSVIKFDPDINVHKPFVIPKRVGFFHTPKDMEEMSAHLSNYNGGESAAANMSAYLMFNLMVSALEEQQAYYEDLYERATGESRPWGTDES